MHARTLSAAALMAAVGISQVAFAAGDDELRQLRDQLQQLKDQYEKRMEALERRIGEAEKSSVARASVSEPPPAAPTVASGAGSGANAFNPAISLILNGTYGVLSRDPNPYPRARSGYRINGFVPSLGEVNPPRRGPSLGETELAISANIDPSFRGSAFISLSPDDTVSVEEASISTLDLPDGFTAKAGRYFPAVGYLNEIHPHAWDFTDAPLANKVFLGGRVADDGVQLRWIAPTESTYFDAGLDAGRGRQFPAGPAGGRNRNGFNAANLFAHVGGDLGDSTAWQVGAAQLRTSPQDRTYEDLDATGALVTNGFSGRSRLWALSGVLKWAPNGNASSRSLKLQGEFFRRNEEGSLAYDTLSSSRGPLIGGVSSKQSGWYLQSVYQFLPRWRVGYRYDRLDSGSASVGLVNTGTLSAADFPVLASYTPTRNTVMTDWSLSEFSRLRLQLARDNSRQGQPDNQLFIQYVMSLGAHGAHQF